MASKKQTRLFSVDADGIKGVVEDLCEALDLCGFDRPLEAFNNPESPLTFWLDSLEDKEPEVVQRELGEQLQGLRATCQKRAQMQGGCDLARASKYIDAAAIEFVECFTVEELD